MIRIEFEKGKGGIVNIINGSLRDIDRREILNIEDVDKVVINGSDFSPIGFNYELNALQVAGYIIIFDSIVSWEPYLKQIDIIDGEIFNPGITGIQYPSWDVNRNTIEGIVAHTYTNTDIEKDLLKGE